MHPLRRLFALLLLAAFVPLASCGDGAEPTLSTKFPERWFTYPVSHIFVKREGKQPGEQMRKVLLIMDELEAGKSFSDLAKLHSEHEGTGPKGGFLGFYRLDDKELSSAIQGLREGMYSGPVDTEEGTHILYRHTFEEGREIESRTGIPTYGFLIPWKSTTGQGDGLGQEEAARRAQEAYERLKSGQLTVSAAAGIYTPAPPPNPASFVGMVSNVGLMRPLYAKLSKVQPGEIVPPFAVPKEQLHWVLKRGHYYRCMVRHILIQHIGVESRGLSIQRTRPEAEALAKEVLAKAQGKGADWDDLVRRYSDDPHTMHSFGSIGSGTNGDFHYGIQEVLDKTPPGQVAAELAETQDGFHIIWRVN